MTQTVLITGASSGIGRATATSMDKIRRQFDVTVRPWRMMVRWCTLPPPAGV